MEPLAAAGYLLIASAALDGIMVGALGGAIAWAVKGRRRWIGLLVAGIYVTIVLRASYSLKTGAVFGIPLLVLTFLISWLTASYLQARTRLKSIWSTPLAICCASIAGVAWAFLFRLGMWAPGTFAAVADVFLILFLFLRPKLIRQ